MTPDHRHTSPPKCSGSFVGVSLRDTPTNSPYALGAFCSAASLGGDRFWTVFLERFCVVKAAMRGRVCVYQEHPYLYTAANNIALLARNTCISLLSSEHCFYNVPCAPTFVDGKGTRAAMLVPSGTSILSATKSVHPNGILDCRKLHHPFKNQSKPCLQRTSNITKRYKTIVFTKN